MTKYVDADKLKAEIERHIKHYEKLEQNDFRDGELYICQELLYFIDSLQQELSESLNGKFVFPNFLYARTIDNKTIDVSYAPQNLDAVEYIKNEPTEQTEVSLENEIDKEWKKCNPVDEGMGVESAYMHIEAFDIIARHFYELGKNSK